MRYGLLFIVLILLQAFNASSQQPPAPQMPAKTRVRLLISPEGQLSDGAQFEMKTLIGGAIITVQKEERGEVVESTIQSVTNNEAANIRTLLDGATAQCPVQLTFVQDQLVQAQSVCP